MPVKSYWMNESGLSLYPKLDEDLQVDVVVVGAGITGITAAYLLKKAGKTVALLERDRWARVDTGHTSAHITYMTDKRLSELVTTFGKDHAQAAWDAGQAAMDQIRTLVEDEKIDCDFVTVPGYLHAKWQEPAADERDSFKQEANLAAELGFDAKYLESVPVANRPGIRFANQAKFHPLRYLAGLLPRIPGHGSHVFEHSEATEFQNDPLGVKVNGQFVRCNYLVLATHVPLVGNTGFVSATLFQTKIASFSSYVIGAKLPKASTPEAIFSDTAQPYYFLRVDRHPRHDYVILGGEDHKTGHAADAETNYARLEKLLAAIFPNADVNARWTGQVVETPDGLPLIGETAEQQFVATAFAGNGMTFGTLAGMMACDAALGRKNPWQVLFDVHRKPLSSAWDYLKQNLDYPFYYLKDKLRAAEGTSLRDVQRGEGKILKINGERLAVYRNAHGNVTKLSPACTHMGCVVHWNQTDATWDCPCHGSRFRATGDVLAGPAETSLEDADAKQ